jgi:hypothetical protein
VDAIDRVFDVKTTAAGLGVDGRHVVRAAVVGRPVHQ